MKFIVLVYTLVLPLFIYKKGKKKKKVQSEDKNVAALRFLCIRKEKKKKGKKKNYRESKKKVSTVARVLPDTVATVLWKMLYEHCKKYCRKKKVQRS